MGHAFAGAYSVPTKGGLTEGLVTTVLTLRYTLLPPADQTTVLTVSDTCR